MSNADYFSQCFSSVGGALAFRTRWQEGLDLLAKGIAPAGITPAQIYCDVIDSRSTNAYVAYHRGTYFIGISDGIVSGVFEQILSVVEKLGLEIRSEKTTDYPSILIEIQYLLNFYALLFVIGHECGHIQLGHIGTTLALGQMASEVDAPTSHIEEAQADLIGAFAMASHKRSLYRLRDLTDPITALALLQVPVACVLGRLDAASASATRKSSHPHPIPRMLSIGQFLLDIMGFFATNGAGVSDEEKATAGRLMWGILEAISPDINSLILSERDELSEQARSIQYATKPMIQAWLEDGHQLAADAEGIPTDPSDDDDA